MEIEHKRKVETVEFEMINFGEVFEYIGYEYFGVKETYMRISNYYDWDNKIIANAVNLQSGKIAYFTKNTEVIPVKAKIVIDEE